MNTPDQQRYILEMCALAINKGYWHPTTHDTESGTWNPLADTEAGRSQCAEMCAAMGIESRWMDKLVLCMSQVTGHCGRAKYADHPSKSAAWQAAACAVAATIGESMP